MYNVNVLMVNRALIKAMLLNAACRRMVGKKAEVYEDLVNMESEMREAAQECQRVIKLIKEDGNKPLFGEKNAEHP
ncbi:hypothetical protein LCGC14_1103380 [marine sediment metagenome]|uniref:Uncharacterized protein n=1 Tax=marine sediment metagenome TaxID=412755 RepID=A0A0F9PS19_9ZZZZ